MRRVTRLFPALAAMALVLAACGDGGIDTTQGTDEARATARDAYASLRTDAERFVDEFSTRQAPEAKQRLLERCRDALEQLRKAGSDNAGQVDRLCNRIRDAELADLPAWRDIRDELKRLNIT